MSLLFFNYYEGGRKQTYVIVGALVMYCNIFASFVPLIGQESFMYKETYGTATNMEKELEKTTSSLKCWRVSVN